jgi:tetratricopeptide (TPR) repeat protein
MLRALAPRLVADGGAVATGHAVAILAAAPELDGLVGRAPGTLTTLAPPEERTRWYSQFRTRRIAHGIVDFLRHHATGGRRTLAFLDVDQADATDREFLAIALARLDPASYRFVVCSAGASLGPLLGPAIAAHCQRQAVPPRGWPGHTPREAGDLAAATAFVASDGTSEVPGERESYEQLDPAARARLHDDRAAGLEAGADWSMGLGALAYHREHGGAPGTDGKQALSEAVSYCMGMGFYDAGLDLSTRLVTLLDRTGASPGERYVAGTQQANCLAMLGRAEEIEPIYYDLLARSASCHWHMNLSYAFAMLYTRLHAEDKKDHLRARAHVNTAIALASLLPDPQQRAFHTAFMRNGLALVEMHLGNLEQAQRLVADGISLLDRELPPDKHRLHRSVLHHNHGQALAALGRRDEALTEFDHVIEADPNYPEYRFDRGNLLNRMGRHADALADYEAAAELGPPFPELYYNRGDLLAAIGDADGAMRDFRYVLDLEPGHHDARVALASLLLDTGDAQSAAAQARAGLAAGPDQARLHCTLALALLELAEPAAALEAFSRAAQLDPVLYEALSGRAAAWFELGRHDEAITDLTAALTISPGHPDLLYNRGLAHAAAGRPAEAIADYSLALEADGADRAALLHQLSLCHKALREAEVSETAAGARR